MNDEPERLHRAEGFVLAGGRSSRMGQEKALVRWAGKSLIGIALGKLSRLPLAVPPRIAGARSDLSSFAAVAPDLHLDCGPLGGIEGALASSSKPLNVFLPVDVPLLPTFFMEWMLERAALTGALVTVPRILGFAQPLGAVYHASLLPGVTAALDAGNYKVLPGVCSAAVALGGASAVDIFDAESVASTSDALPCSSPLPVSRWFHNCNTPLDLAEMLAEML